MKKLCAIILYTSISLCSLCTFAQSGVIPINEPDYNKPKLFQSLPDIIPVNMEIIMTLFGSPVGLLVSLNLSAVASFRFEGKVVSSVSKYENSLQSIVIRSTNYIGARLTVSRLTDVTGNISYTGRMISKQHGDLYELKNVNNQFVLLKRKFHDLVNE
jgi:hypothetical protein